MATTPLSIVSSAVNAAVSSPGIGSGLDVDSIVTKLMAIDQAPLTRLSNQASSYQAQISAYGNLQSALSQFQSAMSTLASASQYQAYTATSSNTSAVSPSITGNPIPASYTMQVSQLAQAQQLMTSGVASATTPIGTGATTTLTFDFGTVSGGTLSNGIYSGSTFTSSGNGTQTVTINSANDTLNGIANAINTANIGVSATVINTGSSTNPYHLMLTSNATGQTSSMQISVSGDATLSSLLTQNYSSSSTQALSQTQVAQNANLTLDSVPITSASNTVSNAISGVNLTLGATTTSAATLTIGQNSSSIVSSVNNFVTAYNSMIQTLRADTSYNTSTKTAGALQGQSGVVNLTNDLVNILNQPVAGSSNTALDTLYQAGVTLQNDGTLSVNSSQLQSAIAANPSTFSSLFAQAGTTSDSQISYKSATSNTQPGTYAINVTQLATQGAATGSTALAGSTTITPGSNDTLNVTLDGMTGTVVLNPGTYTPAQLAAQIQSQINGNTTFSAAGSSVTATVNASGDLVLTSSRYGSASSINITGGNGQSAAGFSTSAATTGQDVAGSINGVTAMGSGQVLNGALSDVSSGLAVTITGGALGARGTVSYSQGYAYQMNSYMTTALSATGPIQEATTYLNTLLQDNQQQQATLNQQLASTKARYMAQFTALDTLMSSMSATSTYLTQQFSKSSS